MGLEERTPLMIASMYGSTQVLKYIIDSKKIDVNKPSDSDGATALHCAAAGGSPMSVAVVNLLLEASADVNVTDANGNKPGDLIARGIKSSKRKTLVTLLKGFAVEDGSDEEQIEEKEKEIVAAKKEYPVDVSMPDINNGVYGSDEFRRSRRILVFHRRKIHISPENSYLAGFWVLITSDFMFLYC